ncbi:MAG: DUF1631 family protein [Ramlibacter sp.]
MSTADSTHEEAFNRCLDSALAQSEGLVQRIVSRAAQTMFDSAMRVVDTDSRNLLVDARHVLLRQQDQLRSRFPEALAAELAQHRERSEEGYEPRARVLPLEFESLELMGEEEVDDTVELLRANDAVNGAVESEALQLNALVSAARGLRVVRTSANPLLPQAWVRALRDATLKCQVDSAIRLKWMQHLSVGLGEELVDVYHHLIAQLKQQGVSAAAFEVKQATRAETLQELKEGAGKHPSTLTLRDLRWLLAGDGTERRRSAEGRAEASTQSAHPQASAGYTQNPGLTVPAAFEALKELEDAGSIFKRMRERHEASRKQRGAQPVALTLTPAQVLSSEVTSLMLANVAGDLRLLVPVADLVRELEPALLSLSLVDPRFFSDKSHPARMLLEELTTRSLSWTAPDQPGFDAFIQPVRQAVHALSAVTVIDSEPFEVALELLRHAWREADARSGLAPGAATGYRDMSVQAFADTGVQTRSGSEDAPGEAVSADRLVTGSLVDLKVGGTWVRRHLAWMSASGMSFTFVNGAGDKPESMTRPMLDRLVELGAIRLAPDRSVVSGALDAVTQTALRNSLEH